MTSKTLADKATRIEFRNAVVQRAKEEVGYVEGAGNATRYGRWFGLDGHPWCAMFVSYIYHEAAKRVGCENPLSGVQTTKGFAGVNLGWTKFVKRGWVVEPNGLLLPGDIVCWDSDGIPGGPGHTGIVISANASGYKTIEGNTNTAFSRTGGMVCEHSHTLTDGKHGGRLGFARPTRRYGRV